MSCSYNPSKNLIKKHLNHLEKNLNYYLPKYENILIIGDFNVEIGDNHMTDFSHVFSLKTLIKDPTCFKSAENPSCIDLILTNQLKSFCHSKMVDIGLSDFHSLTITMLRNNFKKQEPRIIKYRDFRNFSNETFENLLIRNLSLRNVTCNDFKSFQEVVNNLLNK